MQTTGKMDGKSPLGEKGVLYVGALPFGSNEDTIRNLFEPFGPVFQVTVKADWENPTFEPHAFVEIHNVQEAIAKMDGKKIGNSYLRVHEGDRHGN
jgi:RNA recognition motif-containing protein